MHIVHIKAYLHKKSISCVIIHNKFYMQTFLDLIETHHIFFYPKHLLVTMVTGDV